MFASLSRSIIATATAATLAVGALALPADARTVVAFAGRAQNPAESGCFSEWYGTMTNNCAGTKVLFVPLTVDPAGGYTVAVSAYGAGPANNVGCAAYGINKETTTFWGGTSYYLPVFGVPTDIVLSTYVPGSGSLFAACWVNQGGRVNLINHY